MSQYSVVSCCTKADVLLVVCQAVHDMRWALICGRLLGMTNMPHASFVFDKLIPEALEKLALDQIYNGNWQWLVFGPSKPWIFQFNQFYYPLGNAQYIWLEEQEHHGFKSGGWYRGILDGCFILKQTEMLHLWNIYLYSIHGASAKDFGPSVSGLGPGRKLPSRAKDWQRHLWWGESGVSKTRRKGRVDLWVPFSIIYFIKSIYSSLWLRFWNPFL